MCNQDRCQSLYRNLLKAKAKAKAKSLPTSPGACAYFRELEYTCKCDEYYNFSHIRESYKELVGAGAAERIRKFQETEEAVAHYNDWTKVGSQLAELSMVPQRPQGREDRHVRSCVRWLDVCQELSAKVATTAIL